MKTLEDKVAIITGATAGMGKAMAELFSAEGASVVLFARREERLQNLVSEIKEKGGKAVYYVGDVTNQEDVDNLVDLAIKEFGKIDIAINNAGIMDSFKTIVNVDDDLWQRVFDVNVTGPMRLYRAVIPKMIENGGGSLVTVASVGGLFGKVSGTAYTASKHAVIGMSKSVAWTYAKQNIRCNVIAPGGVNTEIASTMDPSKLDVEGYGNCAGFIEITPKMGESEEIAELALFLSSDKASLVNGAIVTADGGWTV